MDRDSQLIFEAWSDMSRRTFIGALAKGAAVLSNIASATVNELPKIIPAGRNSKLPWIQVHLDGDMGVEFIADVSEKVMKGITDNVLGFSTPAAFANKINLTKDMFIDLDGSNFDGYMLYVPKASLSGKMFGMTEDGFTVGLENGYFDNLNKQIMTATFDNPDWVKNTVDKHMAVDAKYSIERGKETYEHTMGKLAPKMIDHEVKRFEDSEAAGDLQEPEEQEIKKDYQRHQLNNQYRKSTPATVQRLNPFSSPTGQGTYADLRDSFCRNKDNQLIYEAYLCEQITEKDIKPIIIPPTDLEECKAIMMKYMDDGDDAEYHGEDPEGNELEINSLEDWVNALPKEDIRHEALHSLQEKEYPGWIGSYKQIDLPGNWENIPWEKKVAYYSRPPEIMAFAFDAASNHPRAYEAIDDYQKIGGDVLGLFNRYVQEYRQRL